MTQNVHTLSEEFLPDNYIVIFLHLVIFWIVIKNFTIIILVFINHRSFVIILIILKPSSLAILGLTC